MNRKDVDLESQLGIEPGALSDDVRARLGEFVAAREQRVVELRERAIDAEQEVQVLQGRVESLQAQVETLEDQLGDGEYAAMDLEPTTVLSSFGEALTSQQLRDSTYSVSDISVDLRANVVNTEEGVRLNLPAPGTSLPADSLSELRFSVRSDPDLPELEYDEIPDLIGMTEENATTALTEAGFEVGTVETVAADAEAGRVVDQLPSPFSLAEPGALVDLEVAEEPPLKVADLVGERLSDAVRFVGDRFTLRDITAVPSDEPPGTVLEQEPDPGTDAEETDGLALTISAFRSPKTRKERPTESDEEGADEEAESDEEAEELDEEGAEKPDEQVPDEETQERAEKPDEQQSDEPAARGVDEPDASDRDEEAAGRPLRGRLAERRRRAPELAELADESPPLVERDITEINGIGDTYGQRLRNAGIESLADLAVAEPIEVADAANVSRDRATDWIGAIRTQIESRRREDEPADEDTETER